MDATPTTIEDCKVFFDVSSLNVAIILGVVMVSFNLIVAFAMNTFGKTIIISKYFMCFCFFLFTTFSLIFVVSALWFILNTLGAFGLIWVDNYYAIMVLMMFVISSIPLINSYVALSSDLFATQYKYVDLYVRTFFLFIIYLILYFTEEWR